MFGTGNCIVENNCSLNLPKNSGTYPTDIAPNVSPWYPFSIVAIFVFFFSPMFFQYCSASLIAISIAVEPLSEKKTLCIPGDIFTRFSASLSAGSFVRLNMDECCNFLLWFVMALINSGLECPHTLHHIDATPSSILLPLESISHIPFPLMILSKEFHSFICVFGCQTELFN